MKLHIGMINVVPSVSLTICATLAVHEATRYDSIAPGAELAESLAPEAEPISRDAGPYIASLKEKDFVFSDFRMRRQSSLMLHSSLVKVFAGAKRSAWNSAAVWVLASALFATILIVSETSRRR